MTTPDFQEDLGDCNDYFERHRSETLRYFVEWAFRKSVLQTLGDLGPEFRSEWIVLMPSHSASEQH